MNHNLTAKQIWLRGSVSALFAAVLNVATAVLLAKLVDASPDFLALQAGPVITATVFTVLVGTAIYALLTRLTARAGTIFAVLAAVVALASLAAPLSLSVDTSGALAGTSPEAALALIPLHLIPAAVLISALSWRAKKVTA